MAIDNLKIKSLTLQLKQRIDHYLWHQNYYSLPFWQRFLIRSAQIIYAIGRDLSEGQLNLRAMSLVYSTVLGFIPTLALTFAVLKSIGVRNAMESALNTLLEGLGDRREQVVTQIIDFVDNIQVGVIGITSMGLLIYLVLEMMRKIETSFNYIWGVSQGRSWSSRVSEYLFAVIVSPLLIFLSISITSAVNTTFFANTLENLAFGSAIISFFAFLFPLLFMSLAFAFAYTFIPNTRVRFASAFIGGMVTTVVWKLMGAFFSGFLITAARESIYLAFATVLAVMIFAYVGWLVALLGSNIAYYHQYPNKARAGRKPIQLSIKQQELLTLSVAALIIQQFKEKRPPLNDEEIAARLNTNSMTTERALNYLVRSGLLARTNTEPPCYLPASSIDDCTMLEIWQQLRAYRGEDSHQNPQLPEYEQATAFLQSIDEIVAEELGNRKFTDSV